MTHRSESDLAGDVVAERYYPERVHYREPGDTTNVYYFDERHPGVVVSRRVHREADGRTYYVEHEYDVDRRYYYDDVDARNRRGPNRERGTDASRLGAREDGSSVR